MASKNDTSCPAARSIAATCREASGGYGFARSCCLRSKRRKYEWQTSMESMLESVSPWLLVRQWTSGRHVEHAGPKGESPGPGRRFPGPGDYFGRGEGGR